MYVHVRYGMRDSLGEGGREGGEKKENLGDKKNKKACQKLFMNIFQNVRFGPFGEKVARFFLLRSSKGGARWREGGRAVAKSRTCRHQNPP